MCAPTSSVSIPATAGLSRIKRGAGEWCDSGMMHLSPPDVTTTATSTATSPPAAFPTPLASERSSRAGPLRAWLRIAVLAFMLLGASTRAAAASPDDAAWFESGRPTPAALQAAEALVRADRDGLEPADYRAHALQRALTRAAREPLDDDDARRLGAALSAALLRFVSDLRSGRVDPRRLHNDFAPIRRAPFDGPAWLRDARQTGRLAQALESATPPIPQYRRLRDALARYRSLDGEGGDVGAWAAPLPPTDGPLSPGARWAGVPVLARRLAALGDLSSGPDTRSDASPAVDALHYTDALVDAVKRFQRRHALAVDGVVGRATLERLNVPPARRVRQIELALERLRWTPLAQGRRMIVINVPEFVLRAYEVRADGFVLRTQMKVIVGQALDKRTPLFDEDLRSIEFSPYWNVPYSIARDEIVPRLRRDPGYLVREGFEFVAANGQTGTVVTAATLAALQAGQLRVRQRPGPRNALGDIKFVFPNASNVYLHHTPSTQLFARERRDFSHGCIRVESPVELARFALADSPAWTEERILEAMENGYPTTARLADPVPVLIAYGTTLVVDGELRFFDDIYGQDRVLDAALREVSATRIRQEEDPR